MMKRLCGRSFAEGLVGFVGGVGGLATSSNTMVTYEHGNYTHCCSVIISYRIIHGRGVFYRFNHHRDY